MSPLPPLPPRLQIEVTNRCALGCTSCARHHWDTAANPIGDLSEDTLDRLAPLLDSAIEVTVGGYGDPTEGPMLLPLVRRAKESGCSVRLITGGAKLTPRLIEELADAGLDRLVLSMDGATDATLRALRGVPLRAWLKWIRAARPLRPIVQLNFVAQWPNIAELPALVQLCDDEGVAGIHAFHLKSYTPDTLECCLLTDLPAAQPHFDAAAALAARLGVFLHLPNPDGCRQPFEHLFVRHDGAVRGCCSGLFEPADFGLVAGRIEDGPEALWEAPLLQQFRAASIGDADFPDACTACAWRVPTLEAHRRPLAVLRA
ncbi:MAG: radical SAM protein [Proteobacteria bacterium]|nr:radical SAM protein [Pseudomonadota bacterium]